MRAEPATYVTTVRLPSWLVEALDAHAQRENRNRNQQILWYLRQGLSADGAITSDQTATDASRRRGRARKTLPDPM